MRTSISVLAILMLVISAVPQAQSHTSHSAPQSALDAALQEHASTVDADRDAVQRVLAHPEVASVAAKAGIDLKRAAGAVSTLGGDQLVELAAQARQVEEALAGGQSRVVISTTLIIIALLVLILIIVAVD